MRSFYWNCLLTLVTLLLLIACGQAAPTTTPVDQGGTAGAVAGNQASGQSHGGEVKDHVSFVDHLRAQGLTVDIVSDVEQPFLRGRGTLLRVTGGGVKEPADIQSYNYDDTELGSDGIQAVEEDVAQIGPDGNPQTTMITWVAPPHFFRAERVIVLYVGTDPAVLQVLTDALGPQFAGG